MGLHRINITDEQIKQIEVMSGIGLTEAEIGLVLGISERKLRMHKAEVKKIKLAYDLGRAKYKLRVCQKLREQIEAGNVTAIIFYLRTKGGFGPFARADNEADHDIDQSEEAKPIVKIYIPDNGRLNNASPQKNTIQ